jgi:hypothetical protein
MIGQQKPPLTFRNLDYRDGLPQAEFPEKMIEDHLGRIWIGYTDGLYVFDGIHVRHIPARITDSTALTEYLIQCLYMDHQERIWIGTRNTGINILHPTSDQFSRILPEAMGGPLPISRLWNFLEEGDTILWMAGKPGIIRHDMITGTFEHYVYQETSLSPDQLEWFNTFRSLIHDPFDEDLLWIGSRAGLLSFSKSKKKFRKHPMPTPAPGTTFFGLDYMIMDMLFSSPYELWCAAWSGGLMMYNTASGVWTHHREKEIPSEDQTVYRIEQKDANTLWIGSRKLFGTYHIPTRQYDFYSNDRENPSSLAHSSAVGSFLFTRDSALLVAGIQALSIADPYPGYRLDLNRVKPFITEILVNNALRSFDTSTPYIEKFSLKEDENTIRFILGWPVFTNTDDIRWRFKLEGKDKDWVEKNTHTVAYSGLNGGRYTFHYQASLDGINWTPGRTLPAFRIQIPFWKHPLFILFNILVIGGILSLFYKMHIDRIKREMTLKAQYNKRITDLEMAALRAQMNPHFLFNALNSIKSYILKEDKREASRYLTKFSRLMRIILNNSKQKFITLKEELDALHLFIEFEEMRFSKKFLYDVQVAENINKEDVYLPPLLLQPFVENAIWHGLLHKETQGNLKIDVSRQNGVLKISVSDNGIGRERSMELRSKSTSKKKSFGLQITDDRIKLIKNTFGIDSSLEIRDVHDENQQAAGTEVIVKIPVLTQMDIEN